MHYSNQTIGHFVELLGADLADRTAINCFCGYRTYSYTYRELGALARQVGGYLYQSGLGKGDRVLVCAENCPEWTALLLACGLTGIVLVPVDCRSSRELLERIAAATGPSLLVTDRTDLDEATNMPTLDIDRLFIEVADVSPTALDDYDVYVNSDDVLEIVFTSGTTSEPKGAVMRHKNIVANLRALRLSLRYDPAWSFLSLLPLSHLLEQTVGCLAPLRFGCQVTYFKRKTATEVAAIIREHGITTILSVPAVLELFKSRIEDKAADLGKTSKLEGLVRLGGKLPFALRRPVSRPVRKGLGKQLAVFICGGGPLSTAVEEFWESLGIKVIQGYGLTEASPIVSCNTPEMRVRGSVGRVLREQRVELADDGEILIAGENVMSGYHERPDLDGEYYSDGWYKTGDIGRLDEAGNLYIVGRKKNMIVGASGMNVYPEDIEAALVERDDVVEAVVFADERAGESRLVAAVVLREGEIDTEQLRTAINGSLEPHQRLTDVVCWPEELPKTPTLKVRRDEVLRLYNATATERSAGSCAGEDTRLDRLTGIVAQVSGADPSEVGPGSRLGDDLGIDSLKAVELAVRLETAFRVTFDEARLSCDATVADLAATLELGSAPPTTIRPRTWPLSGPACLARRVLFSLFTAVVLRLVLGVRVRATRGREPSEHRPVIYVANHQSHLDTPSILRALPARARSRVAVAAAHDHFFEGKRLRAFVGRLLFNMFPFVRQGGFRANLTRVGRCLDAGYSVLVFPEGTRSRDGSMGRFMPGIGQIVREMGVPVVPLRVAGAHDLLPPDDKLPRRGEVRVAVGPELLFNGESPREIAGVLEDEVRRLAADSATAENGGQQ